MLVRLESLAVVVAVLAALLATERRQHPDSILLRVGEAAQPSFAPLPNALVTDLDSSVERLTDKGGELRLRWSHAGRLRIRIRQIGFRFVDTILVRRALPSPDTVQVVLTRLPTILPAVVTTERGTCHVGDDLGSKVVTASVLEYIRVGAAHYRAFAAQYPFRVTVERRTVTLAERKPPRVEQRVEETTSDRWGDPYLPGRVLDRNGSGFSVPILFITALADSLFWATHCFSAHNSGDSASIRVDFSRRPEVTSPDWEGAIHLDAKTGSLVRIEFRLAGLRKGDVPQRIEGYTSFQSPSPYVVIPDTTIAMWWRAKPPADSAWGMPNRAQRLRTVSISYVDRRPPFRPE